MPQDKPIISDSVLDSLKSEVEKLWKEVSKIKSTQKLQKVKNIKFEIGAFDIEKNEWSNIDDADDGEQYDYRYILSMELQGFAKSPEIFLSITAYDSTDPVWIFADNITKKGFDIILETNCDLDKRNIYGERKFGLVISWLAIGE